jgi:hypothetical protein
VVDVKHGRWLTAKIIPVTFALLFLSAPLWSQTVDISFRWDASPLVDDYGNPRAPAIAYKVFHQQNWGPELLIATITDTTYAMQVEHGIHNRIRVIGVDEFGRLGDVSEYSEDVYFEIRQTGEQVPPAPGLRQNFPNPFNPETSIVYGVPDNLALGTRMAIEIYDLSGHRVRLLQPISNPGWHTIQWNGTDDYGRIQPTGQYIVRFTCGGRVQTSKMTMVK